jgi:hypothetical protein
MFLGIGVATTKRAGSASVKATPLSEFEALGFTMVKVNKVDPLSRIAEAPKALLMDGGAITATVVYF